MMGKPPFGQERACSTEKLEPHAQVDGTREGCQPYRRTIASLKAPLWRVNPNSWSGSEISQLEAPLSCARSIARWRVCASYGSRGIFSTVVIVLVSFRLGFDLSVDTIKRILRILCEDKGLEWIRDVGGGLILRE